ncbi:uncharacterized protein LTR77_009780 [Saxophila tyrrhenica]|uniref:Peptidase A1 domain-containing protein n=1 Tax=Saxophila tyrrhenica TaxID=1690608 RepID=A0AAV9NXE9_9PEZI|nr:hypothetical protein LTR77_009780 [Saxophila tyrrhenica]
MHSFTVSAALVASASLALAAPANLVGRSTFEVKQVAHGRVFRNGPSQMMKTFHKYARVGAKAPSEVVMAAAAAQSGEVAADPQQYDQAYLSPVTIGNSELMLDFDTGSADLWAFSNETPASQSQGHERYDSATGTELDGYSWSITYGDQSGAGGNVYTDKVVVGGVTATRQAVEAATSVSASFSQNIDSDGLLGLAFSSINTVQPRQQTTFFDTVRPTLAKALFTCDLRQGDAGSYTFGYIDSSKYQGTVTYVPVDDSQGFWQFTAGGYSVGGDNATSGSVGTAIADTGTSLLYLPAAVTKAYYEQAGGRYDNQQGGYTLPCNGGAPDFSVAIGGKTFTVPGSYIAYAPLTTGSSTCFGGIQPDTGIGFSIFGDVFLKAVYAIFDVSQGSPRLGFAAQA